MTVTEQLSDALKFDENLLAYSIYWSIKKGICRAEEEECSFDTGLINHEEVEEMRKRNELGIKTIKLFSLETTPGWELLVLAENESSARGEYLKEIGILPKSIMDMSDRMDMSFCIDDIGNCKSVRVMKDEAIMFPVALFEYEKTSRDLSPHMISLLYG